MRIVFFSLLLANGLFWLWQTNVFSPPPRLRAPLPVNVDQLVLLEENLPSDPPPAPAESLAVLASGGELLAQNRESGQATEAPDVTPPASDSQPLPATESVPVESPAVIEAQVPPVAEVVEAASPDEPAVEAVAEVAPTPEPEIQLEPAAEPEPQPLALVSERIAPAPPARQCFTLGPFRDPALATGVQIRLAMMDIESSQRQLTEREFFGYAVYLPPRPTRSDAQQLTRELRSRGIDDYYIISSGELENAVSLGLFRERKHADRLILRARELGFQPQTESRYREQELIWLDYEDPDGAVGERMLREISPEGALQRLGRDC